MFSVAYDAQANILRISVEGFWASNDVAPLAAAIGGTAQRAKAIRDDFDVLVESFDFPVQANDVADSLAEIVPAGMALTSGHAAVVVGSLLNRAQAERTLLHPRLRVFMTMEAALDWLARMRANAAASA